VALQALVTLLLALLACCHSACGQSAFPQPRGDPEQTAPAPHVKHALLEMLEESTPVARPERDWRNPDLRAWLAKESLAAGLGVAPLRRLHVPVYVNVFAVGLEGAGALGVEVTAQQLAEWMQHLEHVVPQHVVSRDAAVAENAPAPDDGAAQELEHTASSRRRSGRSKLREGDDDDDLPADESATPASEPDSARISYRYHIRLVQLSPKVVSVVERYLGIHYRVANEKHTEFQVDAEIINGLLEGLVRHLKLDESEDQTDNAAALSLQLIAADLIACSAPDPPSH
jgi:hypothetical protein